MQNDIHPELKDMALNALSRLANDDSSEEASFDRVGARMTLNAMYQKSPEVVMDAAITLAKCVVDYWIENNKMRELLTRLVDEESDKFPNAPSLSLLSEIQLLLAKVKPSTANNGTR